MSVWKDSIRMPAGNTDVKQKYSVSPAQMDGVTDSGCVTGKRNAGQPEPNWLQTVSQPMMHLEMRKRSSVSAVETETKAAANGRKYGKEITDEKGRRIIFDTSSLFVCSETVKMKASQAGKNERIHKPAKTKEGLDRIS